MWKHSFGESCAAQPAPKPARLKQSKRVESDIIAHLGGKVEGVYRLNNFTLDYNLAGGRVLIKFPQNDQSFDFYVGLPFTKGVTERNTGRTLLILGTSAHHIEAMQGQFDGVWSAEDTAEARKIYGDTVRWINVGNTQTGFIGLDYNPRASQQDGLARSLDDIRFLAQALIQHGYDENKRLFILKPPYIVESEDGKRLREQGIERLIDYAKKGEGG